MNTKALFKIGYGMYIVGSHQGEKINAQIANTVFQITSEPPTLAVSINKKNLTWEYIRASRVFAASVLSQETPLSLIGQFGFKSGRDTQKFQGVNYRAGVTGSPIVLDTTVAFIEAKVVQEIDVGTHTIFIGEVVDSDVFSDNPMMSYAYYHEIKRGTTPKTAPSYVEVKNETPAPVPEPKPVLARYKCQVCGYIYDPAVGDPDGGIKAGTPFESIPDNWVCPVCGADKSQFEKLAG